MNKQKKIFHRQEDKLPSTEDIFEYLKEEVIPDNIPSKSSVPSSKNRELDALAEHYEEEKAPAPLRKSYSGPKYSHEKEAQANKKKYEIEKVMLSDPLVSEAIEGYALFQDPKKAQTILAEINRNIPGQSGRRNSNPVFIKIAAMFLGLLMVSGLVVYLYDQLSGDNVIVKEQAKPGKRQEDSVPEKRMSPDSIGSRLAIEAGEAEEGTEESKAALPVYSDAYIDPQADSRGKIQAESAGVHKKGEKIENFSAQKALAAGDTLATKEQPVQPSLSSKEGNIPEVLSEKMEEEKAKRSKPLQDESATNNRFEEGKRLFEQGRYREAKESFAELLSVQPPNQEALYYTAMSDYRTMHYEAALSGFMKVFPANSRYEEARWYMAQIYVETGKKEEAMAVWKELAGRKGSYARRAKGKLKEYSK